MYYVLSEYFGILNIFNSTNGSKVACNCPSTSLTSCILGYKLWIDNNVSLHISPSDLCTCHWFLSRTQRPATQDHPNELVSPPKKPKRSPGRKIHSPSKRTKPSPSGRRKKPATRSRSPKKSPFKGKVESLANGEVSTDTGPPKKTTRRKRSPGGKRVGKSKSKSSVQRSQLAGDDQPDCNSAKLIIPQVVYPPELGYPGPERPEEDDHLSGSKVTKSQPRKKALVSVQFFFQVIHPAMLGSLLSACLFSVTRDAASVTMLLW